MQRTLEILAPGKNIESAKEAIKCGADAVYIASAGMGLRIDYDNSIDKIKELVDFAHKYWVKIYITVNALLFNEADFKKAEELIRKLYEIEVDAIIIQDMGILELDLPPIPLISSTNVCCFTPEHVKFLEEVGFSVAILPRELTLDQIKDISSKTNIKLEAFCYGLLCVGYSGKCYLQYSNTIQNTNGKEDLSYYQYKGANNGKCDQKCMDYYNLLDSNGNYIKQKERLLNLKFNNQIDNLLELFDAGVSAFKIEGRHKELSYVKNVVASFRQQADEIIKLRNLKKASSGNVIFNFTPDLSKVFNKGYTDYFAHGRKKEMYSVNDLVGDSIGFAVNYADSSFELHSNVKLSVNDKLRYRDKNGEIKSFHILEVNNNRYTCTPLEDNLEGVNIYRYFDAEANQIIENAKVYRFIPLELKIEEYGNFYKIKATDEDQNEVYVECKKTSEKMPKDRVVESLSLTDGDNEFAVKKVDCEYDFLFIEDKNLRQEIFIAMRDERRRNRPKIIGGAIKNNYEYPQKVTYLDNVVNSKAKEFYQRHGVKEIEGGMETTKDLVGKQILTGKYCIKNELGYCSKTCKENNHPEPWYLEDCSNNKHELVFDCQKCEMKILS